MSVYVYLNSHSSDPLYHAASFWELNCKYIESVYLSLQKIEKERMQGESVTTAYLTDTVLSIVHSLYGKEDKKYKSQPQVFLPGYQPEEEDKEEVYEVNIDTIKIVLKEIDEDRIPRFALMYLNQFVLDWRKKVEN